MGKVYVDRSVYKQSTCFDPNKKKFYTEEAADLAAENTTHKYGHQMRAYLCDGRHWHITSSPRY